MIEQWMQEEIDALLAHYGTVPPPWVVYEEHPVSMRWRMGGGESHMMVWSAWWPLQRFSEAQKIDYFRRWPPPHCWLAFMIEAIWPVDKLADTAALAPYFERTQALGFGGLQDYLSDFDDPKWLQIGAEDEDQ